MNRKKGGTAFGFTNTSRRKGIDRLAFLGGYEQVPMLLRYIYYILLVC